MSSMEKYLDKSLLGKYNQKDVEMNHVICGCAGIGRLASLRCLCPYGRTGSTPVSRTKLHRQKTKKMQTKIPHLGAGSLRLANGMFQNKNHVLLFQTFGSTKITRWRCRSPNLGADKKDPNGPAALSSTHPRKCSRYRYHRGGREARSPLFCVLARCSISMT